MRIVLLLILALISGCATKYQDIGFSGGVAAQQMTSNTFRIIARGNSYTSINTVKDYMVLKAAETAKQNGATHFVIISAEDASRNEQIVTPGRATTSFHNNVAHTTYSPAMVHNQFKPGQDAYIRIVSVENGALPANAISADEIIKYVGSRVERG